MMKQAHWQSLFDVLPATQPGARIAPAEIAELSPVRRVTAAVVRATNRPSWPVRALLFDKRDEANWSLGWHRTIEVARRCEVPGSSAWTMKHGRQHVSPPIDLLNRMTTVRIHIDSVDADNAPLLIAPGSHRLGLIEEASIGAVIERYGSLACLCGERDAWIYATPILHASTRSSPGRRRRVVQIDYASELLPGGLEWTYTA